MKSLKQSTTLNLRNECGASILETALVIFLLVASSLVATGSMGNELSEKYAYMSSEVSAGGSSSATMYDSETNPITTIPEGEQSTPPVIAPMGKNG